MYEWCNFEGRKRNFYLSIQNPRITRMRWFGFYFCYDNLPEDLSAEYIFMTKRAVPYQIFLKAFCCSLNQCDGINFLECMK